MLELQVMVVGLAVLAVLAIVNGIVDGRAQRRAWRSIAAARHEIWLRRQGDEPCRYCGSGPRHGEEEA